MLKISPSLTQIGSLKEQLEKERVVVTTIQTNNMDGILTKETLQHGKITRQVIVDGKLVEETIIDENENKKDDVRKEELEKGAVVGLESVEEQKQGEEDPPVEVGPKDEL